MTAHKKATGSDSQYDAKLTMALLVASDVFEIITDADARTNGFLPEVLRLVDELDQSNGVKFDVRLPARVARISATLVTGLNAKQFAKSIKPGNAKESTGALTHAKARAAYVKSHKPHASLEGPSPDGAAAIHEAEIAGPIGDDPAFAAVRE